MFYTKDSSTMKFMIHATHVLNYLESTPEAVNVLVRYGFAAQQLPEGRQMLEQVKSSILGFEDHSLRQKAATEQFHVEWKKLSTVHQVHLQAARRCLGSEVAHLLRTRPQSYVGWASQVNRFYGVLLNNPEYQAKLNSLSISSEELVRAHQWLTTLIGHKDQQNQSRHNYRLMQQQRDGRLSEFKRWFAALMALARIAFRDQPAMRQMLHTLTARTPSEPKVTQSTILIMPTVASLPLLAAN